MIKFLHKKHIGKSHGARVVIYYSLSDIILGLMLVALVIFFIHDYLVHNLWSSQNLPNFMMANVPGAHFNARMPY